MKKLSVLAFFALAACGGDKVVSIPTPPQNTTVIHNDVPIPVMCKVEIEKAKIAINEAKRDLKLEEQNAILRQTIAQQAAYIKSLEAGIIGCGGALK